MRLAGRDDAWSRASWVTRGLAVAATVVVVVSTLVLCVGLVFGILGFGVGVFRWTLGWGCVKALAPVSVAWAESPTSGRPTVGGRPVLPPAAREVPTADGQRWNYFAPGGQRLGRGEMTPSGRENFYLPNGRRPLSSLSPTPTGPSKGGKR